MNQQMVADTLRAIRRWTDQERELLIGLMLEDAIDATGCEAMQIDLRNGARAIYVIAGTGEEAEALRILVRAVSDETHAPAVDRRTVIEVKPEVFTRSS